MVTRDGGRGGAAASLVARAAEGVGVKGAVEGEAVVGAVECGAAVEGEVKG
jgi:hypothetical protein